MTKNCISNEISLCMHKVIDEVHPKLIAYSDEYAIDNNDLYTTYYRDFLHKNGSLFRLYWNVYHSETDLSKRTVFQTPVKISY
jgi:hypothetical protein